MSPPSCHGRGIKYIFPLDVPQNLFAVIVRLPYHHHTVAKTLQGASLLCLLLLLVFPPFCRLSYELFHLGLALAVAYAVWQHLPSDKPFPRVYIYLAAGLFVFILVLQGGIVIVQNGVFRHHLSRATITRLGYGQNAAAPLEATGDRCWAIYQPVDPLHQLLVPPPDPSIHSYLVGS